MTGVQDARRIWNARQPRSRADRAYLVYAVILCMFIFVVPLARAVWLGVTSASGIAALSSVTTPAAVSLIVDALWISALAVGRARGPAVLAPFLVWTLAHSEHSRLTIYRRPLVISFVAIVLATTGVAAVCAGALVVAGHASVDRAVVFAVAGLSAGVVAFALWGVGQALPGIAAGLSVALAVGGGIGVTMPAVQSMLPWGWVGDAYPGANGPATVAVVALAAVAIVLISAVPAMLERMRPEALDIQAARWDAAVGHAVTLDFNAASSTYQTRPSRGRHIGAVRQPGGIMRLFAVRDLIGAIRTPGRFALGVIGLACSGMLIAVAVMPQSPAALLGGASGLLMFLSLGPLTDGVRHAAQMASALPLYGIGDLHLLVAHALMPLSIGIVVVVAIAAFAALATGSPSAPLAGLILVVLTLCTRIGNALKGPMPLTLLMPAPSPVGDPMPLVRLAWATDAVLVAVLAGVCAASIGTSVVPVGCVAVAVAGVGVLRWRRRR